MVSSRAATRIGRRTWRRALATKSRAGTPDMIASAARRAVRNAIAIPSPVKEGITATWSPTR
jgi:hypothetical protein